MAEDGVDDFGLAKRKAARQAGLSDLAALPTNEEVERALRDYRQIYQSEEQPQRVRGLRRDAVRAMQRLARFHPHLTGPVLTGLAGKHTPISLHLFTDNPKDVEVFLLNEDWRFRPGEARLLVNDVEKSVPTYALEAQGLEIRLTVLSLTDQRQPIRATAGGRSIERAPLAQVEALVAASDGP